MWPFNDAWLRTSLEEARRQALRNVASILDSAREFGIRDAQVLVRDMTAQRAHTKMGRVYPQPASHAKAAA